MDFFHEHEAILSILHRYIMKIYIIFLYYSFLFYFHIIAFILYLWFYLFVDGKTNSSDTCHSHSHSQTYSDNTL